MLKHIIDFYKVSAPAPCNGDSLPEQKQRLKRLQWSTFLAATLGYSMYRQVLQRFPCGQEQHQPVYVNRFVSDGIDKSLPGFY